MKAKGYVTGLTRMLSKHSDKGKATAMEAYMRNQFGFYGIKSPLRRDLLREFLSRHGKPELAELKTIVHLLWEEPHRESQYLAMDIMAKMIRKTDDSFLPFFEQLILRKSWWDTVDWIAPNGIGGILKRYPEQLKPLTQRYIASDNIWLQRTAILFQLKYREQTDFQLLSDYILIRAGSKEFFVQKAAGWALRQYSKFNAKAVIDFIQTHQDQLSGLTVREGMKWLERNSK